MKTLPFLLAGALAGLALLAWAEPAECEDCMMTGYICYGTCIEPCVCIQPNGPGSQGWCN